HELPDRTEDHLELSVVSRLEIIQPACEDFVIARQFPQADERADHLDAGLLGVMGAAPERLKSNLEVANCTLKICQRHAHHRKGAARNMPEGRFCKSLNAR